MNYRKEENKGRRYYLAYGSNLNLVQMTDRCRDSAKIGIAVLHDYRLVFRGSNHNCHLTIEPSEGRLVPVGVYLVTPRDEANLDQYEGYPFYYYKKAFHVVLDSGDEIEAFAYIMHDEDDFQPGFPSFEYYLRVKRGYEDFGFDLSILKTALEESTIGQRPFGWVSRIVNGELMGFPMTAEEALVSYYYSLCMKDRLKKEIF